MSEELEKDARRYRWLKERGGGMQISSPDEAIARYVVGYTFMSHTDDLDAAIDAEIDRDQR